MVGGHNFRIGVPSADEPFGPVCCLFSGVVVDSIWEALGI